MDPVADGPRHTSYASARAARQASVDRWLAGLLGAEPDVALAAAGSHGSGELTPGSDLDLVLVHRGRPDIAAVADRIWYPVWDRGARLDHAVRTVDEARAVAASDLKAALGLLSVRHIAGDPDLTRTLREAVLADWRTAAVERLPQLAELTRERWERQGELAFLLEPNLKEARGGLRDVHAMRAVAAAWAASGPDERVRRAHAFILDVRHALHEVTGKTSDRLVFQEQDPVAGALGLLDADVLLRALAAAGRTVTYAADQMWRRIRGGVRGRPARRRTVRRPLTDGVVEHDGEAVLARGADPAADPVLVLRAAAAAAQAGLPLAPATVDRLAAESAPMPVPWPAEARDALVTLLGAGPAAIPVWEALDQAGLIVALLPDWERVRNRPQRDPLHRFTVDRHLVETAAAAAARARDVARPDLLLLAALFHDIGKGWPGDHSRTGAVVARDLGQRLGLPSEDVDLLVTVVREHLLLPVTATRRDLEDPMTARTVADAVGDAAAIELLAALAAADGQATGPAAWSPWKAALVDELARRARALLSGGTPPPAPELTPERLRLARHGGGAVRVTRSHANVSRVTVVAPDRRGLLWRAAGLLASHRLAVRSATALSDGTTTVIEFAAVPEFGSPPDPAALEAGLRQVLAGRLDVEARLARRRVTYRPQVKIPPPPPRVTLVDDASRTATVVEVRAHDRPGLLWRIGRALGGCGLDVRAARVETLGAEVVDAFYVVDGDGRPLRDEAVRARVRSRVLEALQSLDAEVAASRTG